MSERLPEYERLHEDSASNLFRFAVTAFLLLAGLLLFAVVYSLGKTVDSFELRIFLNGLLAVGAILLAIVLITVVTVLTVRCLKFLGLNSLQGRSESRKLKKASAAASTAVVEKRRLNEERARLTAQLQAAYLFEKEASHAANAQATREFREALQSSVLRSCEIAYDHISRVVEQYEQVVSEIEDSFLPDGDKAALLDSLTKQLDIVATEERHKNAQRMMETEIWKVRFRKAKLMGKDKPGAAIEYLNGLRPEARSSVIKAQITNLVDSLSRS